jgi:hypothetical protein
MTRQKVCNLAFLLKTSEHIVAAKLNEVLTADGLLPRMQSVYRIGHLMETGVMRVMFDVVVAADNKRCSFCALQSPLNTFACLVTGFRCSDHMNPVLMDLQWLLVHQCIICRMEMIIFECIHALVQPILWTTYIWQWYSTVVCFLLMN